MTNKGHDCEDSNMSSGVNMMSLEDGLLPANERGYFCVKPNKKQVIIVLLELTALPTTQEWEQIAPILAHQEIEIIQPTRTLGSEGENPPMSQVISPNIDLVSVERDNEYYFTDVYLEVEGVISLLPAHHLTSESPWFKGLVQSGKGQSEADAILLENISKKSFNTFLDFAYQMRSNPSGIFSTNEWIAIAKLSLLWQMPNIHTSAIRRLASTWLTSFERVDLGRKFGLANWVRSGYRIFIEENAPITLKEARMLGIGTVVKIFSARERVLEHVNHRPDTTRTNSESALDHPLRAAFAEELAEYPAMDPFKQIEAARVVGSSELLLHAYTELYHRDTPLNVDEFGILGLDVALKLSNTRCTLLQKPNGGFFPFTVPDAVIQEYFDEEILAIELPPLWNLARSLQWHNNGQTVPTTHDKKKRGRIISFYRQG